MLNSNPQSSPAHSKSLLHPGNAGLKLLHVFGIPPERPTPNIAPSWNVAPIDPLQIVHYDVRAPASTRWDLIPLDAFR